jgi:DNA adenine methylase
MYKSYLEPFLGSGAVFFHIRPTNAILGDSNEELINAYATIKEDWSNLHKLLESHHCLHCKEFYYEL